MREELTPRQQEVYDFIVAEISGKGYAPSVRDIMHHLGLTSTNGVRQFISVLEQKGYIRRDFKIARGIVLLDSPLMRIARIWYDGMDWCGYLEDDPQRFLKGVERSAEHRRLLETLSDLGATHYRYGKGLHPITVPIKTEPQSENDAGLVAENRALREANESLKTKLSALKAVNAELKEQIGMLKRERRHVNSR